MGKYYSSSSTTQEDNSLAISGDAQVVTGAGGITALPRSVVLGTGSTIGDVSFDEFPEDVADSVAALVGVVETSVIVGAQLASETSSQQLEATKQIAESFEQSQETLAQKLHDTEVGAASLLPEVVKYVAIAAGAIILGRAVLRGKG